MIAHFIINIRCPLIISFLWKKKKKNYNRLELFYWTRFWLLYIYIYIYIEREREREREKLNIYFGDLGFDLYIRETGRDAIIKKKKSLGEHQSIRVLRMILFVIVIMQVKE